MNKDQTFVDYRLVTSLFNDSYVTLAGYRTNYVPKQGEIVNIKGNPYVVHNVGSAVEDDTGESFVYVSVFKAGCFDVEIGGRKY